MKLNLTLTIFSIDKELITFMATEYIKQLTKILGYKVLSQTAGKHIDASKEHYHIMYNIETQDGKIYKGLNQTLIRNHIKLTYPTKYIADKFQQTEMKISFIHQGEQKKYKNTLRTYGETFMRYAFKEYTHFKQIEKELQYNISDEILESYRKQAHQEWLIVKEKREQQSINEIQAKDDHLRLKEFLEKELKSYEDESPERLITKAMEGIWKYKTQMYRLGQIKTLRVSSVEDQAISYLVFNGYINTSDIVSLTQRKYI